MMLKAYRASIWLLRYKCFNHENTNGLEGQEAGMLEGIDYLRPSGLLAL
jgi:hypothetical protein